MGHFFELFANMDKQGPGSAASTRKALSYIPALTAGSVIADIGCGTGVSTLVLARETPAKIKAFDFHQPFVDILQAKLKKEHLEGRVSATKGDMKDLPLAEQSVDLIWSEGAIFIMGFEQGLKTWKKFLKPGAYVAVTEISWLTDKPHEEAKNFWAKAYPGMSSAQQNIATMKRLGLDVQEHFVLPETDWNEGFYDVLEQRTKTWGDKYAGRPEALNALEKTAKEVSIWRNHNRDYSYVFYIAQCPV